MVKAYLRYDLSDTWGVITSRSDICHDESGKFVFTASLEKVNVWSVKQAVVVRTLDAPESLSPGKSRPVTCLCVSSSSSQLAVGYGDGSVRIWNTSTWELETTLAGHSGAVTCLSFSSSGDKLASGSQDTDIVIWDVSSETGLFKLRGHKGQVTDLVFLAGAGHIASTSKDEHVKVWDLAAERCIQTLLCHGGELWSVSYNPITQRVAVGASDSDIRLFSVNLDCNDVLVDIGSVRRSTGDRVTKCQYVHFAKGSETDFLVCQGAGKVVDVWRVRSEKEAEKRKRKREKRKEEKKKKKKGEESKEEVEEDDHAEYTGPSDATKGTDELELVATIRSKHKLTSFSVSPKGNTKRKIMSISLATSNNMIELWDVKDDMEPEKVASIDGMGHRSDVRSIALSSDDSLCLSTSNSGAKVWNPRKGICISSIDSGYGLCSLFAPGNKHAVVGTKEGTLEILDIGSSARVEVHNAHDGPVWSICLNPDGSGFVSGSADKTIKFWNWTLAENEDGGAPHLSIDCSQTLTLPDDVLCVRFSPNGALLLAALLDSTVKVYFADTLKFFLSLYGHRLPVLTMDVSSDSTLLITGSADKNVKIWGLDYGDCHKSIFAHDDSVMSVAFVPDTHYFFSAGKDKMVKYWDADKFEHLLDLPGHHGEVWALKVSSLGDFLVTGSHDRSIRRWEKTEEAFFVEEEKEKRLETLFEEDLAAPERDPLIESIEEKDDRNTSAVAGKRTLETVSAADSIVEALDMASAEEERIKESRMALRESDYVPNPLLLGLSPSSYVLRAIGMVRASDLEQALILVPFMDALRLLELCASWLEQGSDAELLARVSILLCRVHLQQLMATPVARPTLFKLRKLLHSRMQSIKDIWGYNAAAIELLKIRSKKMRGVTGLDTAAITAAKLKTRFDQ
jgi:U3 small nucleolar RNA-associated protein 12